VQDKAVPPELSRCASRGFHQFPFRQRCAGLLESPPGTLTRMKSKQWSARYGREIASHKQRQLIQFQHARIPIVGIRLDQRFAQSWQLGSFFLSKRSPSSVRPQKSVPDHANCYALHTLGGSLLCVPLDRHGVTDSPGIVFDRHGRDISASRWEIDRYAQARHSRNGDNER